MTTHDTQHQTWPSDPGRTPGKAEGEHDAVEAALTGRSGDLPDGATARDPGRTPGQAEGTEEDVEAALRQNNDEG